MIGQTKAVSRFSQNNWGSNFATNEYRRFRGGAAAAYSLRGVSPRNEASESEISNFKFEIENRRPDVRPEMEMVAAWYQAGFRRMLMIWKSVSSVDGAELS